MNYICTKPNRSPRAPVWVELGTVPVSCSLRQIKSFFHQVLADEEVNHREDYRHDEPRYEHSVEVHESVWGVLKIYEQREHGSSAR